MVMNELRPDTILLILCNVMGILVWSQVQDFKSFLRDTRKKLDNHVENYELHCTIAKQKALHKD